MPWGRQFRSKPSHNFTRAAEPGNTGLKLNLFLPYRADNGHVVHGDVPEVTEVQPHELHLAGQLAVRNEPLQQPEGAPQPLHEVDQHLPCGEVNLPLWVHQVDLGRDLGQEVGGQLGKIELLHSNVRFRCFWAIQLKMPSLGHRESHILGEASYEGMGKTFFD